MALDVTIGGAAAASYGTLAEYQSYAADLGWTLAGTVPEDERNLRRAAQVMDRNFEFDGNRQYQTQALEWPRLTTIYPHGWPINPDTVPNDIKHAQFELAYLLQGGLDPMATIKAVIKSAGAGPTRVEFAGGQSTPRIVALEGLLKPYLVGGGVGGLKLARA